MPIIRKISKRKYVLLSIGKVLKKLAIFSKVVGPLTKNFFVASFMNPQQTFIGIMLDHVQNPALIQGLSIPGLQIRISWKKNVKKKNYFESEYMYFIEI